MRDIKFRAWNGMFMDNDPFDEFNVYALEDGRLCDVCGPDSEPYTQPSKSILMQYTGLTDKNGKEIYEGDVVHAWLADEKGMVSNYLGKVIFNDFEWSIETNDDFWPVASWKCVERCKVVGNIYENPELMEGDQ